MHRKGSEDVVLGQPVDSTEAYIPHQTEDGQTYVTAAVAVQPPAQMVMGGGRSSSKNKSNAFVSDHPCLWPHGVGITDRAQPGLGAMNTNPYDERRIDGDCCPEFCCGTVKQKVWYSDYDRRTVSAASVHETRRDCEGGWDIRRANVMGVPLRVRGQIPQGCCDNTLKVHVSDVSEGRSLGHVSLYQPGWCDCEEITLAEGFDARGRSRFVRRENPCSMEGHKVKGTGEWHIYRWPLLSGVSGQTLGYITRRFRYTSCCTFYPEWVGMERMPEGLTPDDQKLLVAMIHARWWRTETLKQSSD